MARFFVAAAFAATASAAALQRRGDSCGFQIQSSGGVDATMGQYEDGQNRLNGPYATATYYISNGGITDEAGRDCIVTTGNDATHQFQCNLNSSGGPTLGFAISSDGSISFNGNDQFYACPYNQEYNVYTQPLEGQDKCLPIKLSTNSICAVGSTSSATGAASTGYSAPAYATVASTPVATVYSKPAASVYSTPQASVYYSTSEASIYSTPEASVYTPEASIYSTPEASIYSTPEASIYTSEAIIYSTPEASVYSCPAATVTVYETVTPIASAPAYSMQSSSAPVESKPAGTAVAVPATSVIIDYTTRTTESYSTPSTFATVYPAVDTTSTIAPAPSSYAAASTPSPVVYGSSAIISAPSSTQTATSSTTATACQTSLEGSYQTPHLITWVSSSHPDTAYGSEYNATINSDCSTIFNFDIPTDYQGKTCSVIFLFPEQKDLETSAWSWNEEGSIEFSQLSSAASLTTTYDTCPSKELTLNTIAIQAGNSYVVSSGACQAGETISIEASSVNDLGLEFFEDWNPSSLGLYLTAC